MSREREELRRLVQVERRNFLDHAKRLPAHLGDSVSAFAKRHPIWTMGGAAAIAMAIVGRRHRKFGRDGKPSSWPMALAAVGSNLLPDLMRIAGLTAAARSEGTEDPDPDLARPLP